MSSVNKEQPGGRNRLPFIVFLAIGGYFLWTEHQAHVIEYLPFALLFACVGMHFFMHGSHGGHSRHSVHDEREHHENHTDEPSTSAMTHKSAADGSETDRRQQS